MSEAPDALDAPHPAGTLLVEVDRWQARQGRAGAWDAVAVEEPVALVFNGISHAVLMATPTELEALALGFALSEGLIESRSECRGIDVLRRDAGIEVQMEVSARAAHALKARRRQMEGRTGCGLCGIESLAQLPAVPALGPLPVWVDALAPAVLLAAFERLPQLQPLNARTGALHAAAWADPAGRIEASAEDVGRHNALDKLIGAMLRAGIEPASGVCLITSRCSYEMVQKAVVTGFPILAAVSAPTLMARRLAEAHNLTLVALARHDSAVLVSHPERVY